MGFGANGSDGADPAASVELSGERGRNGATGPDERGWIARFDRFDLVGLSL